MKKQGKGIAINILEKFNALNVEIPQIGYGSRYSNIHIIVKSLSLIIII